MLPKPVSIVVSLLSVVLAVSLLAGCGWPRVHKVIVQQGNVITQEMIDKLKPGMTRTQVAYIMGEPVVRNTFNDDRWDYVYSLENPGFYEVSSTMSLFFENERLSYFTGNLAPTSAKPMKRPQKLPKQKPTTPSKVQPVKR
jgi:outer membrane protein assembly factor BamE